MKKTILVFGLGAITGAIAMYLLKEKELEELREFFDEEDDFEEDEYEDDFLDEDLEREDPEIKEEVTFNFEELLKKDQPITENDIED